jgi:hypothetical protein
MAEHGIPLQGYEGGAQAGVGTDSDAGGIDPDPNQQFGGELPGDPGSTELLDGGEETNKAGTDWDFRDSQAVQGTGVITGGGRPTQAATPPPEQQWQPPPQQPWQPPTQPLPKSATGDLPDITEGASTVSTPTGYRPGLMKEGQMSDIIGHDPFNMPTSGFGTDADAFLQRMKGPQSAAHGGPISAEISTQGYIPPDSPGSAVVENGMGRIVEGDLNTPNTTGVADDRVAFQKPELEEVDSETAEMLEVLEWALQNPEETGAQQAIHTAVSIFGQEYVANVIQDLQQRMSLAEGGPIEGQAKVDNLIEMDFRRRLAEGRPLKVGAAVQGGEFVFTKKAVENAGGPEAMKQMMSELEQRNA